MSLHYLGCLRLKERTGQGARLRSLLQGLDMDFLASAWTCRRAPEGLVANEFTGEIDEMDYYARCWDKGEPLEAQFGSDGFLFSLKALDWSEDRVALLGISARALGGLADHLEDMNTDFYEFFAGLEDALQSTTAAMGEELTPGELLDATDGKLDDAVVGALRLVSKPTPAVSRRLRSAGFMPRRIRQHDLLLVTLPPYRTAG